MISIGWDQITSVDGKEDNVVETIKRIYPKEKQPRYAYKQVKRFFDEIKINDVVLIPSENSEFIRFGIVESDVYLLNRTDIEEGSLNKRRKIRWVEKPIERKKLDSSMFYLFNSHHIITDATEYGPVIDRTLHSFFIKGDIGHLVVKIKKEKDISTYEMNILMNNMLNLVEIINYIEGTSYNPRKLHQKSNIQSPGFIEFITEKSLIISIGFTIGYIRSGTLLDYAKFKRAVSKSNETINEERILDFQKTFIEGFQDADAVIPDEVNQDSNVS
jgi:hypothetical protein